MFFSSKIKDVTPSKTSIISDLVFKLKREGKEIISMAAGELDLAPKKNIKSKAIEVIKNGDTLVFHMDNISLFFNMKHYCI